MSNDNPHRPVLIVIAGPNGSGKPLLHRVSWRHEWMEDAVYINPDIIAQEKFGDWNSYDAVMQSVKYCEALREECLLQRRSHIFETVLSAVKIRLIMLFVHVVQAFHSSVFCVYSRSYNKCFPHCWSRHGGWSRCTYYKNYFQIL